MFYQFDQYQVDTDKRKLFKGEEIISDDKKTIKLLILLCDKYPEIVEKQTLMDELWPDQVVTDWSLSRLVSDVRQLLCDSGKEQDLIKTIRGRGFSLNSRVSKKLKSPIRTSITRPIWQMGNWGIATILAMIIAVSGFYFVLPDNSHIVGPPTRLRVAVLPVVSEGNDPINEWIKYGIMSMASEQLARYQSIQVLPVATVINVVSALESDLTKNKTISSQSSHQYFEKVCGQIGCSHLVLIQYRLDMDSNPVLTYQLIDNGHRGPISEFEQPDVMDAADMLLDYLVSDLLPKEKIHLGLEDTFSTDKKANRDYAIGVNELLSGDYRAALNYLNMAIERRPNFTWAKAYRAESLYRSGDLEQANQVINSLKESKLSAQQLYFLRHLSSNVLYTQGKLQQSLQISLALQNNPFVKINPLLLANELLNIGSSYQAQGKLELATSFLTRAQQQYNLAQYPSGEGKALFNLANVFLSLSKERKAIDYYQQAREVFIRYNMVGLALMAKHQIATTSISLGRLGFAESELRLIIENYQQIDNLQGALTAEVDLVYVSIMKNNFEEAANRAELVIQKISKTEFSYLNDYANKLATESYLRLDNLSLAQKHFKAIKGKWQDKRPGFVFIPAHLTLAKGLIKEANAQVLALKENLGKEWTAEHEKVLVQFAKAQQLGKVIPIIY